MKVINFFAHAIVVVYYIAVILRFVLPSFVPVDLSFAVATLMTLVYTYLSPVVIASTVYLLVIACLDYKNNLMWPKLLKIFFIIVISIIPLLQSVALLRMTKATSTLPT